jgi:hypothetical protein
MIRITIDTCLINVNKILDAVNRLEELNNQKKIQLVATVEKPDELTMSGRLLLNILSF